MQIQGKNNRVFEVIIHEYEPQAYFGYIRNEHNENMGEIYFKLLKGKTFLQKIQTFQEFQHIGVGQAMLDAMEYVTIIKESTLIEGKFFPSNSYARPFYEKNGYKIEYDNDDTILYKYVDKENLLTKLNKKILMVKKESTSLEI